MLKENQINLKKFNRIAISESATMSAFSLQSVLSYFIIIVSISPYDRFISNWVYGVLVLGWLFVTALVDAAGLYSAFIGANGKNTIIYLWVLYRLLASLLGHAQFAIETLMVIFILQMFWYYSANIRMLKRQAVVALSYYALIVINSIFRLLENPMISRELAGASFEHAGIFMANFSSVYSVVFLCLALIILLLTSKSLTRMGRICTVLGLIAGSTMLVLAQYTIAILIYISFATILLIILTPSHVRLKMAIWLIIILIISFLLILPMLDSSFVSQTEAKLQFLLNRATQVEDFVFGRDINSLGVRPTLYNNSFSTFLENPLWGAGNYIQDRSIVGEHSEVFDTLARYGLVGFMCFAMSFGVNLKKIMKSLGKSAHFSLLYLSYALFLFLNPGLHMADSFTLFYLVPALFLVWGKNDSKIMRSVI